MMASTDEPQLSEGTNCDIIMESQHETEITNDTHIDNEVGFDIRAISEETAATENDGIQDNSLDNEQTLRTVAQKLANSAIAEQGVGSSTTTSTESTRPSTQENSNTAAEPTENDSPPSVTETQHKTLENKTPVEDPFVKATKFLEKHQLLMLFQTLTADVVLKRPPEPLDFMIEEIETIQEQDRQRKGVFINVNKQSNTEKSKSETFGKDIVGEGFDK